MKKRVAQEGHAPGSTAGIPLARFTQPTRLIIQRLLLEGREVEVGAELLRGMLDEPMTGVYGVTSEQSNRARQEIQRLVGPAFEGAVSLEAFSDATQRVILLVAEDRGGSELAPESVSSADLERYLDRDMTLLPGVGGGKAMRARREIREVLQEVLGREISVAPPRRSPDMSPRRESDTREGRIPVVRTETQDPPREADAFPWATVDLLENLESEARDLARRLQRAGNGVVDEETRTSERESVRSLGERLRNAYLTMENGEYRFRMLASEHAGGSDQGSASEWSHELLRLAHDVFAQSRRRLYELDGVVRAVGAELGAWRADSGRGDALNSAYLLVEAPGSFVDGVRETRRRLRDCAELFDALVREQDRARSPAVTDQFLIGSPALVGAVIRGEDWARVVEEQGVDATEFTEAHARRLRDLDIARRRRAGESLAAIGVVHGMTRERVRQIVRDVAVSLPDDLRDEVLDAGRNRRRAEAEALRERLLEVVISVPRPELAEIAERLGVEPERAWEALGPQARKFVRRTVARDHDWQARQWSDDAMKEALLEASLYVAPFSGAGYDEALAQGLVEGPSRGSIINRFGTWNDACIAAGISPNPKRREEYERRWSDDELIDYLVRFIVSDAPTTSHAAYELWRLGRLEEGQDIPSTSLIRIRLGGWAAAVERGWEELVARRWLDDYPEARLRLRAELIPGEVPDPAAEGIEQIFRALDRLNGGGQWPRPEPRGKTRRMCPGCGEEILTARSCPFCRHEF